MNAANSGTLFRMASVYKDCFFPSQVLEAQTVSHSRRPFVNNNWALENSGHAQYIELKKVKCSLFKVCLTSITFKH